MSEQNKKYYCECGEEVLPNGEHLCKEENPMKNKWEEEWKEKF